jgi:hypothetical protein
MLHEIYSKPLYNIAFWDCNCVGNYIHKKPRNYCPKCGITEGDCPDSKAFEVENMYDPAKDTALHFLSITNKTNKVIRHRRAPI